MPYEEKNTAVYDTRTPDDERITYSGATAFRLTIRTDLQRKRNEDIACEYFDCST
jgi:hypothetical protein